MGFEQQLHTLQKNYELVSQTGVISQQIELLEALINLSIEQDLPQNLSQYLLTLAKFIEKYPWTPWNAKYLLLRAKTLIAKQRYAKAKQSAQALFSLGKSHNNLLMIAYGFQQVAHIDTQLQMKQNEELPTEKIDKAFRTSVALFDAIGCWHESAKTERYYAEFLDINGNSTLAEKKRYHADQVDPHLHQS